MKVGTTKVNLSTLKGGDVFEYEDGVYVKLSRPIRDLENSYNAMSVGLGTLYEISNVEVIAYPNAKLFLS